MLFPVRCFTCNKVVACFEESFNSLIDEGKTIGDALNLLNIRRYCCRRMFLGYVNNIDKLILYSESDDTTKNPNTTKIIES
jgi:DNA-directed RNA polymerase I, II, and III subunit RPABC5